MNNVTTDTIDWSEVRWEFEHTPTSMRKLAKKYSTNAMAISRRARSGGWQKFDPVKLAEIKKEGYKLINPHGILGTIAVRKIQEIIDELGDNYSPVDEPLVVMYAESYQRYIKLVTIVDKEGEVCVSPKTGATYMNPYFTALQSVKSELAKLGDKLGLSIASRKRLGLVIGRQDEDKTQSLFDFVNNIASEDIEI